MKKIILIFTFIFCFSYCAYAQWKIGGKVGANWSKVANTPDGISCTDYKPGFNAGVVGSYQFNNWIGVQAEVLYSMRGYKLNDIVADANGEHFSDLDITQNYLDIPILAKFYPFDSGLNIQAGAQLGFPISQSMKTHIEVVDGDLANKNIDLGIVLGAAYEFNWGMFVDFRYIIGITDNYNGAKGMRGMSSRSLQASIGYNFNL